MGAEEWRLVADTNGEFAVSSMGRLRREVARYHTPAGYIMKGHASKKDRYHRMVMTFTRDGKTVEVGKTLHKIVAEAFLGPCPEGMEIDHQDGVKGNNRADNLEYVTRQENIDRAVARGLIANKGERNTQAKLTAHQVRRIRSEYATGLYSYGDLGRKYGCDPLNIRAVIKRISWKHV
jgi:HNH endonuclease